MDMLKAKVGQTIKILNIKAIITQINKDKIIANSGKRMFSFEARRFYQIYHFINNEWLTKEK